MGRLALLLNLDAEEELEARRMGRRYATSRSTRSAIERAADRLAPLLPAEVDSWTPGAEPPRDARHGLAWCPTPDALTTLRAAGLEPVGPAPDWETLADANDRTRCAHLVPAPFDGVALDLADVARALGLSKSGESLRLRRALSAAGRGLRRVGPAKLAAGDRDWVMAALRRGPLSIAPQVELGEELALHGWLGEGGALELGALCASEVDAHGQWRATRRNADGEHAAAMERAARAAGAWLRDVGYCGPFGVDGFTSPELGLVAPTEFNARYSMGWWRGFGAETNVSRWHAALSLT